MEASRFAELVRISGVGYKATENVKIRRKKLHAQKKGYGNVNNKDYGAGMHSGDTDMNGCMQSTNAIRELISSACQHNKNVVIAGDFNYKNIDHHMAR